ncbi:MAG: anacyclamide/piricyclamide family prenylated cyclic peptide [Scytonema sp. PMC 1069.18]|nr:anacyclamide/piricyclamide family prenylated cyclic peptide [Scytonema sp. PMC 1069.18]MEC4881525.1 anacyclamide/piricyclamide family prenylated cyclic peptide [Scytonema sp. PMC 1070.18]
MSKRNLFPQQTAPVARETNTKNSFGENEKGIVPSKTGLTDIWHLSVDPFAGDDAK